MAVDAYQKAKKDHHYATDFVSLQREDIVASYYRSRGYQVLSENDGDTRKMFGIATGPVADLVIQVSAQRAIIAEVKGKNLDDALVQLAATVPAVKRKFRYVACKVFTSIPVPSENATDIRGENFSPLGYRAVRIFYSGFPGEWPLWKLTADGGTESFRLGDEPVCMIFGPFAAT